MTRVPKIVNLRVLLSIAGLSLAGFGSAHATTVTLPQGGPTGNEMVLPTFAVVSTGVGTNSVVAGDDYVLGVPGQYSFNSTFGSNQTSLAPLYSGSAQGPYTFLDSYQFVIGTPAAGNVLTASLSLPTLFEVTNLQLRLYRLTGPATQPIIGSLSGQPATLVAPWDGPGSGQLSFAKSFTGLDPGTYVLDVAGIASGTSGGTYVGQLNLSPVPLPAGVWLLLSGLGAMGASIRRRKIP